MPEQPRTVLHQFEQICRMDPLQSYSTENRSGISPTHERKVQNSYPPGNLHHDVGNDAKSNQTEQPVCDLGIWIHLSQGKSALMSNWRTLLSDPQLKNRKGTGTTIIYGSGILQTHSSLSRAVVSIRREFVAFRRE